MKGVIVNLKYWSPDWAKQIYEWYWSGEYPLFFRNVLGPVGESYFTDFQGATSQTVLGIFAPEIEGLLGLVTIYDFHPHSRTVSCGILVRKDVQKMHIGTDAFLAVFKYLFETKGVRKISIEFVEENKTILHMINFMGKFLDAKVNKDTPVEQSPFFEGRRKKHVYSDGKFHDVIMASCFRQQYDLMTEKYYGKR